MKHPSALVPLYFMKVYLKSSPECSAVRVSTGAVEPKTDRKWDVCSSMPTPTTIWST